MQRSHVLCQLVAENTDLAYDNEIFNRMSMTGVDLLHKNLDLRDLVVAKLDLLLESPDLGRGCFSLGHNPDLSCAGAQPPLRSRDL